MSKDDGRVTHGGYGSPEYVTRRNMIQRCYGRCENAAYDKVLVCDRWLYGEGDLSGFECFLLDIGPKPSQDHSIDRIDSDGHYEPGNCQWLLKKENYDKARAKRYSKERG